MANKQISDLVPASSVGSGDLFVLEQGGVAKNLTGYTLIHDLAEALDGHGGISTITLTGTSGLVKTYTITYADDTTTTFAVSDGNGIASYQIRYQTSSSGTVTPSGTWSSSVVAATDEKPYLWTRLVLTDDLGATTTSYSVGYKGLDGADGIYITNITSAKNGRTTTVTITMSDSGTYTFNVDDGDAATIGINSISVDTLAEGAPATVNVTNSGTATAAQLNFTFGIPVGATGAAATTASTTYEYAYASSNSAQPQTWYSTIAAAYAAWGASVQGTYLWTKTQLTWNTGTVNTIYTNTYQGIDGTGLTGVVKSLFSEDTGTSLTPDNDGAVHVTAADLGTVKDPALKSDGQVLMWDNTSQQWYAGNTSSGTVKSVNGQSPDGYGAVTIRGTDILIDSTPSTGKVVVTDSSGYLAPVSVLPVSQGGTGYNSVDDAPTSASNKMVKSGGVYTALAGKLSTSGGTVTGDITQTGDYTQTGDTSITGDLTVSGVFDQTSRRCEATISSVGWYRAIVYNAYDDYSANGYSGEIVTIKTVYTSGVSCQHDIKLFMSYNKIVFLGEESSGTTNIIDKIRYAVNGSKGYVDIHWTSTTACQVNVSFDVASGNYAQANWVAGTLSSVADAPSGETVVTTYSFGANGVYINADLTVNGTFDVVSRHCSAELQSTAWYRVLSFETNETIQRGAYPFVIDLCIRRAYNNNNNELHKVSLLVDYDNIVFGDEVSLSNMYYIRGIRYTTSSTKSYIDIRYSLSQANEVSVDFTVHALPSMCASIKAESLQSVADAPAGETVQASYVPAQNCIPESKWAVWTNSSPTSGFAAQTVNVDLSRYSMVEIEFSPYADDTRKTVRCPVGKNCNLFFMFINTDTASDVVHSLGSTSRSANVTTSGITFGNGQMLYNGAVYQNWTNRSIPTKIWGIK